LVASYDFSVVAWEVQTTMHFAEKNSAYDPFDVQVIAIQEDLRRSLVHNLAVIPAEDSGHVRPWHAEPNPRAYLFDPPYLAVVEFFGALGDGSVDAVSAFWLREPVFGSPPEDWDKLKDLVEKVGMPGAFGTIIVGLHNEPATLMLALAGLTAFVRIIDPVASAVGTGLAEKIRRAFDTPTERCPRMRRARGRRETRPADG
jgi:hypothetical protein